MKLELIACMLFFWLISVWSGPAEGEAAAGISRPKTGGEEAVLGSLNLRTSTGASVSLIPLISRKALVITFWSTRCQVCRSQIPRLNDLNSDTLTKVVAVNEGDSAEDINKFMADNKIAYEVVIDPYGAVARAFKVAEMPSCVIIGRSGLIVYRGKDLPEEITYYLTQ